MTNNQLRKRLNALFADLEKLADAPPSQTASIRREIDELRERLHELETAVRNSEKRAVKKEKAAPVPPPAPRASGERTGAKTPAKRARPV